MDRIEHGVLVALMILLVKPHPRITAENLLLGHVHAEFLHIFLIDAQNLHLAALVGENCRAADILVENQRFQ